LQDAAQFALNARSKKFFFFICARCHPALETMGGLEIVFMGAATSRPAGSKTKRCAAPAGGRCFMQPPSHRAPPLRGWLFWMPDDNGDRGMMIHKWLGTTLTVALFGLFAWRLKLWRKNAWASAAYLFVGIILSSQ
jgi:hypothetical protein